MAERELVDDAVDLMRKAIKKAHIVYDPYEHELSFEIWLGKRKVTLLFKPEMAIKIPEIADINNMEDVELKNAEDVVSVLAWLFQCEQMYQELLQQAEHVKQLKVKCLKFASAIVEVEKITDSFHFDETLTAEGALGNIGCVIGEVVDEALDYENRITGNGNEDN